MRIVELRIRDCNRRGHVLRLLRVDLWEQRWSRLRVDVQRRELDSVIQRQLRECSQRKLGQYFGFELWKCVGNELQWRSREQLEQRDWQQLRTSGE
jgi:hypothetical protein